MKADPAATSSLALQLSSVSPHPSSLNLHTFFEKFDLFADAPGAVAKMRELVLHMAVSGKLSEEDKDAWTESLLGEVSRLRRGYDLPTQVRRQGSVPIFAANGPVGVHEIHMVKGPGVVTGRSGSIGKVHFINEDFWPLNTALYVEDFFGNYPQFICLLLRSLNLDRFSTATAVPTLNRNVVHKEIVKVPPIAEQKRIVAKVDELMALCDRLDAQQQERETRHTALARAALARFAEAPTPANLQFLFHSSFNIQPSDLRKSILTLAVQGKLVPQDPNDEPAESILRATRSLFEHLVAAKRLSAPKPLPAIEEEELPFSLPRGWVWCRLGQLIRISSGDGLTARNMNEGPIPVYGGNGVTGYHDRHNVAKRTLVIGRVGFYCGSIHMTPEKAWVTDNAFITTFDEKHVAISFLSWLLKATDLRERDNATAQPVISGAKVNPIVLAIPPLAEQRRIVAKVDQLMALVDELETQLAVSRATAANLLSALVAELTGQA
ncbi:MULTISPECIES: restriction endonuclease subunit S [unclassified Thiocapsa]|uniref:restriction endonuclease subunit S n=1 Tax=unclassified Thiocapsa TaxID=2641286 RepID=UPI0035B06870